MPVGLAPSQLSHPLGSLEPSAAPALCLGSEPSEGGDLGWEGQDPISAGRPRAPHSSLTRCPPLPEMGLLGPPRLGPGGLQWAGQK